jgi:glycosyltransferase involved in cell wall biosynthesis
MGQRPELSIVMIAYNVEHYIRQALDSALMQQVDFGYEIVIGEDCSTDRTREVVLEYARRYPDRIRPLLRTANLGMNRNFMETLLAARGRFIALLDGDDYWTAPHKLQKQMDFLRANPEFSTCFHNALVVYEDEDRPPHPFHVPQPQQLISHHVPRPVSTLAELAGGNFMQTCSVMFRAGLYGELPDWYLRMPTFDWPLHVLNAEHGDIGYIDEVMGAYRVHAAGFWSRNMIFYRTIEDVEAMIRGYGLINRHTGYRFDRVIRGQLLPLYRRAAEVLLEGGQRQRAFAYALKGLARPAREHMAEHRQSLALLLRSLRPGRTRARGDGPAARSPT